MFLSSKGADQLPIYSVAQLGNCSVEVEVVISSNSEPTNQEF